MELGSWALIQKAPSLIGLLPLLVFMVISFKKGIHPLMPVLIAVITGFVLTGNGPVEFGRQLAGTLSSSMATVGFLSCMAGGLSRVLTEVGISKTACRFIVEIVHIKTKKAGLLVIIICEYLLTFFTGSLTSAAALSIPVLVPVFSVVSLTPAAVVVTVVLAGIAGLMTAPFFATTAFILELTGLSYGEYFIFSGGLLAFVLLILAFFCGLYVQKKSEDTEEPYGEAVTSGEEASLTAREKWNASIFFLVFSAWIVYAVTTGQGMTFIFFVTAFQTVLAAFLGKLKFDRAMTVFLEGFTALVGMLLVVLLYQVMVNVIQAAGGFEALGNLVNSLVGENLDKPTLIIMGTLVGVVENSGATQAQILIMHELFGPLLETTGLSMNCWCTVLLAGAYLTQIVVPGATIIGPMGICRSNNMKHIMIGLWIAVVVMILFLVAYAFIMPALIG